MGLVLATSNQISPVLSAVPIAAIEHGWHQSFREQIQGCKFFLARYVDNRMLIAESSTIQLLPFQTLTLDVFYGSPVILEDVGDEHLLGFDIDTRNRTISFIQPKSQWQIRHYLCRSRQQSTETIRHQVQTGVATQKCMAKRSMSSTSTIIQTATLFMGLRSSGCRTIVSTRHAHVSPKTIGPRLSSPRNGFRWCMREPESTTPSSEHCVRRLATLGFKTTVSLIVASSLFAPFTPHDGSWDCPCNSTY